jgi:hypothetical protein
MTFLTRILLMQKTVNIRLSNSDVPDEPSLRRPPTHGMARAGIRSIRLAVISFHHPAYSSAACLMIARQRIMLVQKTLPIHFYLSRFTA